jgi:hypothetical protein
MGNIAVFLKGVAAVDIPAYVQGLIDDGATGITQVLETQGGFLIIYTV